MKRGLVLLVSLGVLTAAGIAAAQTLFPETPVLTSTKNERNPALDVDGVGADVLAFTRSRPGYPRRVDAYAKEGANAAVKLNAAGQAWTGGIDYPLVSYQQIVGGNSDVYLYDLGDDTREYAPMNTAQWEWRPSISGTMTDYRVLFGRDSLSNPTQRILLHHHSVSAHNTKLLSEVRRASYYLQPDQLNGDFATFTRCTPNCNVFRHQISTDATVRLTKPSTTRPRQQYAGGVTDDGVVFLVRSGPNCGEAVRIVSYANPTDPGTVVASLPNGRDIATGFLREDTDGTLTFVYDRVNCNTERFDVYKIEVPPGP